MKKKNHKTGKHQPLEYPAVAVQKISRHGADRHKIRAYQRRVRAGNQRIHARHHQRRQHGFAAAQTKQRTKRKRHQRDKTHIAAGSHQQVYGAAVLKVRIQAGVYFAALPQQHPAGYGGGVARETLLKRLQNIPPYGGYGAEEKGRRTDLLRRRNRYFSKDMLAGQIRAPVKIAHQRNGIRLFQPSFQPHRFMPDGLIIFKTRIDITACFLPVYIINFDDRVAAFGFFYGKTDHLAGQRDGF